MIAQSWWIASELMRRHPKMLLIETHPGGGQYDCLTLTRPAAEAKALIDLNRNGRIHVHSSPAGREVEPIPWATVMRTDNAHEIVKVLEVAAALDAPASTPRTGPSVLAFRIIARILTALVNAKDPWDARNEYDDTSGWECSPRGYVEGFPTAAAAVREQRPTDLYGVPQYRYWALLRDGEPLAILDTDGLLHLHDRQVDLVAAYKAHNRVLGQVIAAHLGHLLP